MAHCEELKYTCLCSFVLHLEIQGYGVQEVSLIEIEVVPFYIGG